MGLLPIELPEETVERLQDKIEANPAKEFTIDLERRELRCDEGVQTFDIDDYTRWRLLEGLDDIGLTLRNADAITTYEQDRKPWLPVTA
jgi:3-isopropylmalate/(R)-2-methylmalate dehydratase small subunit